MSLTLNWTKPSRAKHLLDRGVAEGLLERTDDGYSPLFEPSEVDVPFGFDPPSELFEPVDDATSQETPEGDKATQEEPQAPHSTVEEPESPVLEALIDAIAARMDQDRKRAVAAVNAKQEDLEGLVTLPAAALIVAKKQGVNVESHAQAVLENLSSDAKAPA